MRDNRKRISQRIAKAVKSVTESVLRGDEGWSLKTSGRINALRLFLLIVLIVELFITNFLQEMKVLMEKNVG